MKPLILMSALLLSLAPLTGACGRSTESDQAGNILGSQDLLSPIGRPSPGMPGEYIASGKLSNVNLDAKTLMLNMAGTDYTFEFDDQSEVEGRADDVQGLVGSTGATITIHYREEDTRRHAVRIELEDPLGQQEDLPNQ